MSKRITALSADERGNIFDEPGVEGAGRVGNKIVKLRPEDLIRLPDSADLMYLPGRRALGFQGGEIYRLQGQAVSAILPQGYTRTHLPAFESSLKVQPLPLYGYTAAVLYKDELHVAALCTDENRKWEPRRFNTRSLPKLIRRVKRDLPRNRLVDHLAHCSLAWHCLTAQNLFYGRWECGVPTSPTCNANCLGCLSLQACGPSPQSRIAFKPSVDEIAELCIYHLNRADEPIVSFGQGCEGEPTLQADTICAAIKKIRAATARGQININTNAGCTAGIKKLVEAGLDSMRVSIISADAANYQRYYRAAYDLAAVKTSTAYALARGVYVSLNMLCMPGFNDRVAELAAWRAFLTQLPVAMIQLRNLNFDPELFFKAMPPDDNFLGTRIFLRELKSAFPKIALGNFSHYVQAALPQAPNSCYNHENFSGSG